MEGTGRLFVEIWDNLCEKKVQKVILADKIQHATEKVLDIIRHRKYKFMNTKSCPLNILNNQ